MITKIGHLGMEPPQVMAIFTDTDNWPHWMPGIRHAHTLDRTENSALVVLDQRFRGREFHQEIDCRFSSDQVHLRQRKGNLRRWECNWRFAPPPDGQGTTVTSEIDMELGGMMGLVVSGRMLNQFLEQTFRDTLQRLEQRGRSMSPVADIRTAPGQDVILQMFETDHGLELWFEGQIYRLKA
jgi:ribosome-associated toxin RatA of RatAB toxin-antitoxin module